MTLPRSSKTARLKQLNAFFRRIGGLPAKRKKESRRQQLSLAYSFVLSDA
jgi:hypothetical protein